MKKQERVALSKYLYIARFIDQPFFKIGISSNNLSRFDQLDKIYPLDKENTMLCFFENPFDSAGIEKTILAFTPAYWLDSPFPSSSEFRALSFLPDVMDAIKDKARQISPLSAFLESGEKLRVSNTQSIRFNPRTLERIQVILDKKGFSSVSEFVNFLVMDYVEKEEEREKIIAQIGLLKVGR